MRFARVFLLVALAATVAAVSYAAAWLNRPLALAGDTAEFSVEPGKTSREIAEGWVRAGVQTSPFLLYQWFRWSGRARQIRAGSYEIGPGTTPIRLLEKMVRGDETLATVRFTEGWTFRQIRAELARADGLKPTTASMSDAEVMTALGAPGLSPEGRFLPDTYAYSKGSTDLALMKRAYRAMAKRLAEAWQERDPTTPLQSADEALTLASIVEKETGVAADRGRVAGVLVNRLRIGMPLQTDPTVIYGLGAAFDGNLHKRDLLTDGPYNSYTLPGLPPTPIAVPGRASLLAAVRPEQTKALYFVSRGDGSSEFSETLADHNRAVNRYQRKAPAQ
ncbi:MAG: endolytic transglycosylase MltG [Rhizobacter sp.]|nr:endolytic transglycosylase MltG [Rhizobacter sp.]